MRALYRKKLLLFTLNFEFEQKSALDSKSTAARTLPAYQIKETKCVQKVEGSRGFMMYKVIWDLARCLSLILSVCVWRPFFSVRSVADERKWRKPSNKKKLLFQFLVKNHTGYFFLFATRFAYQLEGYILQQERMVRKSLWHTKMRLFTFRHGRYMQNRECTRVHRTPST